MPTRNTAVDRKNGRTPARVPTADAAHISRRAPITEERRLVDKWIKAIDTYALALECGERTVRLMEIAANIAPLKEEYRLQQLERVFEILDHLSPASFIEREMDKRDDHSGGHTIRTVTKSRH